MKAIINGHIISNNLEIENGYIIYDNITLDYGDGSLPRGNYESIIDAENSYVLPGLIDIHMHGANGIDSMSVSKKGLEDISLYLARNGVTSFLLTTVTDTKKRIKASLRKIENYKDNLPGANLLGVHLEGPFINSEKAGAHNRSHVSDFDYSLVEEYLDLIKIITFAPEVVNNDIYKLSDKGIKLSVGHTNASYELGKESIDKCDLITHLFNAMPQIHHRDPAVTTAALLSDCFVEIIADNIHLHPAIIELVAKLKEDKIVLVTDSIAATGQGDGEYVLGGLKIEIKGGVATLKDSDTLAGSTLTLLTALKNMITITDLPIQKVIEYATYNPARVLGLLDRGQIKNGMRADYIITKDLEVVNKTIILGEEICV
jgi:N-acetylglucosamine-6-phosphate deacetylase